VAARAGPAGSPPVTSAAPGGPLTLAHVSAQASSATRGRFITIEGPEGAGKTTQAARLETYLNDRGTPVIRTREPGGTPLGERIRELLLDSGAGRIDPLADALLFNAARHQLVAEVIEPALASGTTVICARYADSTRAYQGYGSGLPLEDLDRLETIATDGLRPDLTILLDVQVEVGLARKAPDDQTRFETAYDLAFHRRVRNGFLAMAVAEPGRFVVLDATAPADAVAARIERSVDRLLHERRRAGEPNRPVARIQR
jgi:dTMP kinase